MRILSLVDTNFQDYKKASMFIGTATCSWKCEGCQNKHLAGEPARLVEDQLIIERYISNPLTSAIIFGGLEPFDQFDELLEFINAFREKSADDIVIYSGYTEEEISLKINKLKKYKNIIVKVGRYVADEESVYDPILGITLISNNQYAINVMEDNYGVD